MKTGWNGDPEPMGKLDTVTVNGPEDDVVDWDAVDWRAIEDDVRPGGQLVDGAAVGL